MDDDGLGQLLRQTDAATATPDTAADLADRVRGRDRIRRARRALAGRLAAAAAVLIVVGVGAFYATLHRGAETGNGGEAAASAEMLQARIAALDSDARVAMSCAAAIERAERRSRGRRRLELLTARPDPLEVAQRNLDAAAFMAVYHADGLARDDRTRAEAIRTYQEVIRLFPETRWAAVARQRLAML
ncbi:MAG: hypothetical protein JXL80_07630 [Planctomycetes bacterium]|nr:hypothetical protein [Planctomycetota bacterium]